jgi:hypothetical protein
MAIARVNFSTLSRPHRGRLRAAGVALGMTGTLPAEVLALLALRHPTRPSQRLPLPLRKLLPDPMRCFEDLQRFSHADLAAMTPAMRRAEAFRWKVAIAQVEPDEVPLYVLERVARLEAA